MSEEVCGRETEVNSRISGYYRPVKNWNAGKSQEFKERNEYDGQHAVDGEVQGGVKDAPAPTTATVPGADEGTVDVDLDGLVLFSSKTCPNCKMAKEFMTKMGVNFQTILAEDSLELIKALGFRSAPTLGVFKDGKLVESIATYPNIRKYIANLPAEGEVAECETCHF